MPDARLPVHAATQRQQLQHRQAIAAEQVKAGLQQLRIKGAAIAVFGNIARAANGHLQRGVILLFFTVWRFTVPVGGTRAENQVQRVSGRQAGRHISRLLASQRGITGGLTRRPDGFRILAVEGVVVTQRC